MNQQLTTIAILFLLLLGVVAPFSALAGLMLIVTGALVYGLLVALVRALVSAEIEIDPVEPVNSGSNSEEWAARR